MSRRCTVCGKKIDGCGYTQEVTWSVITQPVKKENTLIYNGFVLKMVKELKLALNASRQ